MDRFKQFFKENDFLIIYGTIAVSLFSLGIWMYENETVATIVGFIVLPFAICFLLFIVVVIIMAIIKK